jgi:hypothetical protein
MVAGISQSLRENQTTNDPNNVAFKYSVPTDDDGTAVAKSLSDSRATDAHRLISTIESRFG